MKFIRAFSVVALLAATFALLPGGAGASGGLQIGGLEPVTYAEGGPPVPIAEGVTISGGGTFADGYIEFAVTGATAEDRLFLPEGSAPDPTEGAVTVIGSAVYLGLGGGEHKQIGTVNDPNDGRQGRPLRIDFSAALPNSDFSGGVDANGHPVGWTVNESQIAMGALASKTQRRSVSISGSGPYTVTGSGYSFTTDKLYSPSMHAAWAFEGDERTLTQGTFDSAVMSHGGRSEALRLFSANGRCPSPNAATYCSAFGPDAWSSTFEAKAGDDLAFDWSAANGGDDYEVYGFLVDEDSGEHHDLMYGRGNLQSWTTSTGTIPSDGTYRFRFVSGTYDATGGFVVGASLYIDNVRVLSSDATDAVAQSVARLVHYEHTGKDPRPEVEIGVTAETPGGGSAGPETVPTEVTLVDDAPEIGAIDGIELVNTAGADTFATTTGTIPATDPEGDPITHGLIGGVEQSAEIGGLTYTHAVSGAYGTLHLDAVSGRYAFVPDADAVEARTTPDSETFTVSATANGLVTTGELTVTVAIQTSAPGAPTDLVAQRGDRSVELSWQAPSWTGGSPVTGYRIEVSSDGGTTWSELVASTGDDATTRTFTGLEVGEQLTHRVSATNTTGTGHPSEPVTTTVAALPGAPTITSVKPGNRVLIVSFAAPGDDGGAAISGYEYSVDGGITWTVRRDGTTASPMVIGPLENDRTHPVRIRALNTVGAGAASNEVAASPKAAPVLKPDPATPPAPTGEGVQLVDGVERPIEMSRPSPLTGHFDTPAGTLRFSDGSFQVDLLGLDAEGKPLQLDARGRLIVVAGAYAQVSGEGFRPGSTVDVWLLSTPVHLGDVVVGADGTFSARMPIPDDVQPGPHTIQLNGVANDGTVRTLSVGVVVQAAAPGSARPGGGGARSAPAGRASSTEPAGLAFTGAHALTVSLLGVALLSAGAVLAGAGGRRRRVQAPPAR